MLGDSLLPFSTSYLPHQELLSRAHEATTRSLTNPFIVPPLQTYTRSIFDFIGPCLQESVCYLSALSEKLNNPEFVLGKIKDKLINVYMFT